MSDPPPDSGDLQRAQAQLHRSGEVFLAEVQRLASLERRKQAMEPGDDARASAALEIEDVSVGLATLSRYQTRLIQLQDQMLGGVTGDPRKPHEIIEEWREAERQLHEARTAMEQASDRADRLRQEHHDAVRRQDR